jgi:hypothetical protein
MDSCIGAHKCEAGRLPEAYLKGIRRSPQFSKESSRGGLVEPIIQLGSPGHDHSHPKVFPKSVWQRQSARSAKNMVANGETESKD